MEGLRYVVLPRPRLFFHHLSFREGLLSSFVAKHMSDGGVDPRLDTRSQMVSEGVPLVCAPKGPSANVAGGLYGVVVCL